MSVRTTGVNLVAGALFFWLAWWLMPAVGITDTREIFEHVAAHRTAVLASVGLQLCSTMLYTAALVGVLRLPDAGEHGTLRSGAALLLLGTAGSTADAVLHLLAFEMTAPGIDRAAMVPVMERMQGPNLALLAPLLAAFFVGTIVLAIGAARSALLPRRSPWLFALALPALPLGGGLALLAVVCASQAWLGITLARGARA